MSKEDDFSIIELEAYFNLTQRLIDDTIRKGNLNNSDKLMHPIGDKLSKLNKCRRSIMNKIEAMIYERFLD